MPVKGIAVKIKKLIKKDLAIFCYKEPLQIVIT